MIRIRTLFDKRHFCPTPKDIENNELKKLAKRLKGDSEKENLTNILEWQDRNIQFWWERWPFALLVVVAVATFLFLLTCYAVGKLFHNTIYVWCLIAIALIGGCLFIGAIVLIVGYLVYSCIRYKVFIREKPIKEKMFEFMKVVYYTFTLRLPVDKILEYKLAVCRDYAKLTASLLFNIYPDSELYFITTPAHVAVGIEIKNKIYVIDQHLPILTIDKWKGKKKKIYIYKSKLIKDSRGKTIDVTFDMHASICRESKVDFPKINTEKLTEEIANILEIKQSSHKDEPDFKITLPNYAIYYDDDEITKYSLIRAIKNRLENEVCGNMNKISKVNISQNEQNKRDLTAAVYLST